MKSTNCGWNKYKTLNKQKYLNLTDVAWPINNWKKNLLILLNAIKKYDINPMEFYKTILYWTTIL